MNKLTLNLEALRVESFDAEVEVPVVEMTRPGVCDPFTMGPRCP